MAALVGLGVTKELEVAGSPFSGSITVETADLPSGTAADDLIVFVIIARMPRLPSTGGASTVITPPASTTNLLTNRATTSNDGGFHYRDLRLVTCRAGDYTDAAFTWTSFITSTGTLQYMAVTPMVLTGVTDFGWYAGNGSASLNGQAGVADFGTIPFFWLGDTWYFYPITDNSISVAMVVQSLTPDNIELDPDHPVSFTAGFTGVAPRYMGVTHTHQLKMAWRTGQPANPVGGQPSFLEAGTDTAYNLQSISAYTLAVARRRRGLGLVRG